MTDFASKADRDSLTDLWQSCFGDSEDYIRLFLDTLWTENNGLVLRKNGKITSMLFLLDGSLRCGGEQTRSGYIYAACTAPEHRGKGYMSALLNGADDIARRQGKEFLCLVPSEQSLFEYYARFGYLSSFKTKKIVLSRFVLEQIADTLQSVTDPSPKELEELRSECLAADNAFIWGRDVIEYAREETLFTGGKAVYAAKNGRLSAYAFANRIRNRTVIKELCVRDNAFGTLATNLLEDDAETYEFHLPMSFPLSADRFSVIDKGMLKPLTDCARRAAVHCKDAYIGLTLE